MSTRDRNYSLRDDILSKRSLAKIVGFAIAVFILAATVNGNLPVSVGTTATVGIATAILYNIKPNA